MNIKENKRIKKKIRGLPTKLTISQLRIVPCNYTWYKIKAMTWYFDKNDRYAINLIRILKKISEGLRNKTKKINKVRMIRKYHIHTLQTNPRHREKEQHNIYNNNLSVRQ